MGGGSGRRETAVDESRKETADRAARYQTDYVGRTYLTIYATRTVAAASGAFCCASVFLSVPLALGRVLFTTYIYVVVLLCFVCHISGGLSLIHI